MCFKREGNISKGSSLELVDKFLYLGSNISATESDIHIRLTNVWTGIKRLWIIWKFDLSDDWLFYGVSTLFRSFNDELSHFDKRFKQFGFV